MFRFVIWNADRACVVGKARRMREAVAIADTMEMNSGEHYVVLTAEEALFA